MRLARAASLLNTHRIARASSTTSSSGCAGGFKIGIVIAPRSSAPMSLNAYRCASHTTGNVDGDLVGFLQAIGVMIS